MIEDRWRTVLVVDNDAAIGRSIAATLAEVGYDVVPGEANSAVQLARILRPSAIVMSIDPAIASSLGAEIRALDGLHDVFIVAMCSGLPPASIDECVELATVAAVISTFDRRS
ncbi:MAG: hypothetical protein ABI867_44540 [Kofleriaceae bacterium]